MLTRNDFKREMLIMAESCVGNKKNTAKNKASKLFNKFDELIKFSKSEGTYYENQYKILRNALNALKTGFIDYSNGCIRISEIESYKETDEIIILNMKSGKEIRLNKDFNFIKHIFI